MIHSDPHTDDMLSGLDIFSCPLTSTPKSTLKLCKDDLRNNEPLPVKKEVSEGSEGKTNKGLPFN